MTLARFPMFAGLQPADEAALLAQAVRRRVRRGTRLFDEGDPARGFYLVLEGCVKIFKVSASGAEQVLALVGAGQTFAEAALFQPAGVYPASAEAVRPSDLLFLEREALVDRIRRDPDLALRLLGGLSMKLRRMVRLVEDLSLRDARARVARYLLSQMPEGATQIRLPASHAVLARLLGLANETLSRTLRGLKAEGVLETVKRGAVQVGDPEALRALAGDER